MAELGAGFHDELIHDVTHPRYSRSLHAVSRDSFVLWNDNLL